jgi:DNA polymerase
MVVGEGPGADEDAAGRPFVGRAGKVLDGVLAAAGIPRENVWVTNTVRCRPTSVEGGTVKNRPPRSDEVKACSIWMSAEIEFVSPQTIICLGAVPAKALISRDFRIGEGRGQWHTGISGILATATYHPAYLLRLRGEDRERIESQMVEDFTMVAKRLGG